MGRRVAFSTSMTALMVLVLTPLSGLAQDSGSPWSRQVAGAASPADRPAAVAVSTSAAAGGTWAQSYGLSGDDELFLLRRTSGGYLFGGSSAGQDGSNLRALLLATDVSGTVQWAKAYSGVDMSTAAVEGTPDGGYLISGTTAQGVTDQTFWLAKLDAAGAIQWQKSYGSFSTGFATAYPLDDGGFVVSGVALSFLPTPSSTLRLMRLDSSGIIVWQEQYASQDLLFGSVVPLPDQSFIGVGYRLAADGSSTDAWAMKLGATGAIEWQRVYVGNDSESLEFALPTGDGGFMLVGGILVAAGSDQQTDDSWLVKVDATGNIVWQKTYGGPGDDLGFLQDTGDGGYLLTGYTTSFGAGSSDVWVAKLDGNGGVTWSKAYGGAQEDSGVAVPDSTGGYLLVGITRSFGAGGYDGWVAKLDSAGTIVWQRTYGGPEDDQVTFGGRLDSLLLGAGGFEHLGRTGVGPVPSMKIAADEMLLGGDTASYGAGGRDLWVAQLDSEGQTSGSCSFIGEGQGVVTEAPMEVAEAATTASAGPFSSSPGTQVPGSVGVTASAVNPQTGELCGGTSSFSASASASPTTGAAPLVVSFTGSASNGTPPYTYQWDFGDGSATSSQQNPSHTYSAAGSYSATLTVHDATSATASDSVEITVSGGGCSLSCSASVPSAGVVDSPVSFTSTVSATGCSTAPIVLWSFGDGGTAQAQNTSHSYAAAGSYDWALAVSADTQTCFDNGSITISEGGGERRYQVAGVAHAPGSLGSAWRTNIGAVNRGGTSAALTLVYTPYGGGTPVERSSSLAAGATVEWQDILVSLFGVAATGSAKGTVEIRSNVPLSAAARTYNQGTAGTFGQYLPAIEESDALTAGEVGFIPLLEADSAFRTNLGVLCAGSNPCTVAIMLHDAGGSQVGSSITQTVASGDYWQQNNAFAAAGAGDQETAYATVEVQAGVAWAFASVVDNGTQDPTTIPVATDAATGQHLVGGVAHAPGALGSVWRTNIGVVNPGTATASLTLTFLPDDGSAAVVRTETLQPGATAEWRDILVSLFGLDTTASAKGAVQIASARPLYVSARTYNQDPDGTFGQYLPAITTGDAIAPGQTGVIPLLAANSAFRSNLGVLNPGSASSRVTITLHGESGAQVGSVLSHSVEAGHYWQQNNLLTTVGAGSQNVAYATVEVEGSGSLAWAFGSVVDNGTSDPTTVVLLR